MKWLFALAAFAPVMASAQDMPKAEPACVRAEIVPGFETFGKPAAGAPAIGKAVALTLRRLDAPPPVAGKRPVKPGSYQGHYLLKVATAGDYRIALSQGAWIWVGSALGEVESTAHGHGPACSGIAKIVTFPLKAGTYRLVLSEAKTAGITVGVTAGR